MCPFTVTVENIPDRELGPLLTRLAEEGFDRPIITPVGAHGTAVQATDRARRDDADLPESWQLIRERTGESYRWPKRRDHYARYRVFVGTTRAAYTWRSPSTMCMSRTRV